MFERYYERWNWWITVLIVLGGYDFYFALRLIYRYRAPDPVGMEMSTLAWVSLLLLAGVVLGRWMVSLAIRKGSQVDPSLLAEIARTSWATALLAFGVIFAALRALQSLLVLVAVRR